MNNKPTKRSLTEKIIRSVVPLFLLLFIFILLIDANNNLQQLPEKLRKSQLSFLYAIYFNWYMIGASVLYFLLQKVVKDRFITLKTIYREVYGILYFPIFILLLPLAILSWIVVEFALILLRPYTNAGNSISITDLFVNTETGIDTIEKILATASIIIFLSYQAYSFLGLEIFFNILNAYVSAAPILIFPSIILGLIAYAIANRLKGYESSFSPYKINKKS